MIIFLSVKFACFACRSKRNIFFEYEQNFFKINFFYHFHKNYIDK